MSGVFINYRRDDSAGYAGRLADRLGAHFGRQQVFMDISDIEPGLDFAEAISAGIGNCDVLLVIMSKQWLGATNSGGERRIDDPDDHLRLEISSALERKVRVIPVLVRGATMPAQGELPDALSELARKQAIELSDDRWDYDVQRLLTALEKIIGVPKPAPSPAPAPSPKTPSRAPWVIGGAVSVTVIGLALFANLQPQVPEPEQEGPVKTGPVAEADPPRERPVPASSTGVATEPDPSIERLRQENEQLRANLQAQAAAPPPQIRAPAGPVNMAGTWYDEEGNRLVITQQGLTLAAMAYDGYGNLIAQGSGVVEGRQLGIQFVNQFAGGMGIGTLEDDGRHMSSMYTDYATGMTESGRLHKDHLPGQ